MGRRKPTTRVSRACSDNSSGQGHVLEWSVIQMQNFFAARRHVQQFQRNVIVLISRRPERRLSFSWETKTAFESVHLRAFQIPVYVVNAASITSKLNVAGVFVKTTHDAGHDAFFFYHQG
jgi:hypothetical protein